MNKRKFVMAKIALPIEVGVNNEYILHKDRVKIDFGFCTDLPGPTSAQDNEVVRRLFPSWGASSSSSQRRRSPSPEYSPEHSPEPSVHSTPNVSHHTTPNHSPQPSPQLSPQPSPQPSPRPSPQPSVHSTPNVSHHTTPQHSPQVSRSPSPSPIHCTVEPEPEELPDVYTPRSIRSPSQSPPRTRPSSPIQPSEIEIKTPEESARALFMMLSQKDKTHKHKARMTFRKYPSKVKNHSRRVYD